MSSSRASIAQKPIDAGAVRKALAEEAVATSRQASARKLAQQLSGWIVTHRRAGDYFVDLQPGSSLRYWGRRWNLPSGPQTAPGLDDSDAIVLAAALIALEPVAASYRRATAAAFVAGQWARAYSFAQDAVSEARLGRSSRPMLLLFAQSAGQVGRYEEALDAYREVALAGTSAERCNALAAGTTLAADRKQADEVSWFAARLRAEAPPVVRRWFECVFRTRGRRLGQARMEVARNHMSEVRDLLPMETQC